MLTPCIMPGTPLTSIAERARRYLAKCPPAISRQRGHNAAYHAAAVLVHGFALPPTEALALLRDWNCTCQPPWSEAELRHKVNSAAAAVHREPRGYLLKGARACGGPLGLAGQRLDLPRPPKPVFRPDTLKRIAAQVADIGDVAQFLARRSAVRVDVQDTASVLRWLYPRGSGEKVILFNEMKSAGQLVWEADRRDAIQAGDLPTGSEGVWFLPQPVDGLYHPNPRADGRLSRRAAESVTSWRYMVLESDEAAADYWLRCLVQIPLRISSICESGGRSIHALVRLDATSKADWDRQVAVMKPVLVTLGADAGALSAVRLSRLPQAMRGERCQRLLYLNPMPDGTPILRQNEKGGTWL